MFSIEIETLARLLIDEARERQLRLVTAESCTGGLVAGAICAIPGASDVFERGFIVYNNRAKQGASHRLWHHPRYRGRRRAGD